MGLSGGAGWNSAPVELEVGQQTTYTRTDESQLPCTVRAMYLGAMSHGSAAMSHGLSCHVPPAWLPCSPNKFPWRPIPARKGCFISQTGSCLTCFLWVMTCLAHSFLNCFHPQPQAYHGLRWCRLTAHQPSVAGLLAVRGVCARRRATDTQPIPDRGCPASYIFRTILLLLIPIFKETSHKFLLFEHLFH